MASRPLTEALRRLGNGGDLARELARSAVAEVVEGTASEVEIAALLTSLRVKGETADELAGAVEAVRSRMLALEVPNDLRPLLDTCGTGGDGASTLNVSTAAAIVVAAGGVRVAKHGNRSASGNCGSAEVLAELGVAIESPPEAVIQSLRDVGIAFLFAPSYHPALKHAAPVRRQLPFRTLFNLVGPLANPARPEYQLVGVPGPRQADLIASALLRLGVRRAAVVTGSDGLDEVTLAGPTRVLLVESGACRELSWSPADFGLPASTADRLRISGPTEGASRLRAVLDGECGPARDVVLANASAALWTVGLAGSVAEGAELAARLIDSGAASSLLDRWSVITSTGRGPNDR